MKREGPPRIASWALAHLTPPDWDEALAGDLLEEYSTGRSDGWYWRQTVAACVTAWMRRLSERKMPAVFAVIWTMLVPFWIVLENSIQDGSPTSGNTWSMDRHFTGPYSILVWLVLNSGFLWIGMLVYFAAHTHFTKAFDRKHVARALLVVPPVFLVTYFSTFILTNLYFFPGPIVDRRTMSLAGELTDLRMWADVLRIPYFVTLLFALWGTGQRFGRVSHDGEPARSEIATHEAAGPSDAVVIAFRDPEEWSTNRFLATMICAGLLNAFIAALLFCRLPDSQAPGIAELLARAAIYVSITALAGVAGTWFYWSEPSGLLASAVPVSLPVFALIGASAWVWLPAAILLSPQDSPAAPALVAAGAALLASGMRRVIPAPFGPETDGHELFTGILRAPQLSADGYIIAACIFLAFFAFASHRILDAGIPLAVCGWLISWRLTLAPIERCGARSQTAQAARRFGWATAAAIPVTLLALLFGVAHRNVVVAEANSGSPGKPVTYVSPAKESQATGVGVSGYESIILWPAPEKKQILPPLPERPDLLPPEATRPVLLRFTGEYWYFQPPNVRPGLKAHQAHGSPLRFEIRSVNAAPLTMEAHQKLGGFVRVARCREIQIVLANRDNHAASVSVAVLLADSASPGKPALYLGQQPVVNDDAGGSADIATAQQDVLRFAVPKEASVRKFDDIRVAFIVDSVHELVAPQMAIERFEMIPR